MVEIEIILTVGSVIAGLASVVMSFRLQREASMGDQGEPVWLAPSDRLMIAAGLLAFVALGIVVVWGEASVALTVARAALVAAIPLCVLFWPAVWSHYRIIYYVGPFDRRFRRPRENAEGPEALFVRVGYILSAAAAAVFLAYQL